MWCNFNYCSVDHVVTRSHMYLHGMWGSWNIHIGIKPVFGDNFRCAGVSYISDFFNDYLELTSIEMLNLEFGINMNFYNGIKL